MSNVKIDKKKLGQVGPSEDELDSYGDSYASILEGIDRAMETKLEGDPNKITVSPGEYLYSYNTKPFNRQVQTYKGTWSEILDRLKGDSKAFGEKIGPAIMPSIFSEGPDLKEYVGGNPNTNKNALGQWRQIHCVHSVHWLIIDVEDHYIPTEEPAPSPCSEADIKKWVQGKFPGVRCIVWSSYNHGVSFCNKSQEVKWVAGKPRIRVMIPLADPINADQYAVLWDLICEHLEGAADEGTGDPTRLSFTPRIKNNSSKIEPFILDVPGSQDLDVTKMQLGSGKKVNLETEVKKVQKALEKEQAKRQEYLDSLEVHGISIPDGSSDRAQTIAQGWLERSVDKIKSTFEGDRHHTIHGQSYWIGTLVGAGMLDRDKAFEALNKAGEAILPDSRVRSGEVRRTVADGIEKGMRDPYDRSQLIRMSTTSGGGHHNATTDEGTPYFSRGDEEEICLRINEMILDKTGEYPALSEDGKMWIWNTEDCVWIPVDEGIYHQLHREVMSWNRAPIVRDHKISMLDMESANAEVYLEKSSLWLEDVSRRYFFNGVHCPDSISCAIKPSNEEPVRGVIYYDYKRKDLIVSIDEDEAKAARPRVNSPLTLDMDKIDEEPVKFIQALRDCWQNEEDIDEMIQCLQEWIGITLLGMATKYETALIFPGSGSNGKSTILTVIKNLLPPDYVCEIPIQDWSDRWKKNGLLGKHLNLVEELPSRSIMEGDVFKRVVTGVSLQFEEKNEPVFVAAPKCGTICAANTLPYSGDTTHGFWKRLIVLPFRHTFPKDEQNPDLKNEIIEEELDQVFTWAIKGAMNLIERGVGLRYLIQPQSSDDAKLEWKVETDPVAAFVEEELEECDDRGDGLNETDLFEEFKRWSADTRTGERLKKRSFGKRLEDLGYDREQKKGNSTGKNQKRFCLRFKTDSSNGVKSNITAMTLIN